MYILYLLRSLIFSFVFSVWTIFICIVFSPFLILRCKALYWSGLVWCKGSMILLRFICGIKYKVVGKNNLPQGPYIVASKHQSAFETIVFWEVFYIPTFVLKKELLKIPFFGFFLSGTKMIAIDRRAGISALKKIVSDAAYHISKNRHIIIYPEGTRTELGKKTDRYQPAGIMALYKSCNVPVVPVALNSGKFWRNKGWVKYPGTIIIKILPPIASGMDKKEFLERLHASIEGESLALAR